MEQIKNWAEFIYYVAFIILTGMIVYYARRTFALESTRNYELLCNLVIYDPTTVGHVTGVALEIYNAGNIVARNILVSSNGESITAVNFIKPNSSFYFPIGKMLRTFDGIVPSGDERIPISEGETMVITLSVDGKEYRHEVNTDIAFAFSKTDTGSLAGIEKRLDKIESAIKAIKR